MAGEVRRNRCLAAALAVGLSAIAYAALFPPFGFTCLSWVVLCPVLWIAPRLSLRSLALWGSLYGALSAALTCNWVLPTVHGYFEKPFGVSLFFAAACYVLGAAPFFGLFWIWLGVAFRKLPRGLWLCLIPAAWVAQEILRVSMGIRAGWALLGAAHFESERLRQLASVTGVYGVSAVLVAGNVAVYQVCRYLWDKRKCKTERIASLWFPVFFFATVLCVALVYGELRLRNFHRLSSEHSSGAEISVLAVQGNNPSSLSWKSEYADKILMRYVRLTVQSLEAAGPADLVIWPEQVLQRPLPDLGDEALLHSLVDETNAVLLMGAPRWEVHENRQRIFNSAHLFQPHVAERLAYDKIILLPFSEAHPIGDRVARLKGDLEIGSYSAGLQPNVLVAGPIRAGVMICIESIYPSLARALARNGAGLLAILSNDSWLRGTGGPEQHFSQGIFRAIETGLPMLRVTTTGISAVVDASGEVQQQLPWGTSGVLRARLPAGLRAETPYVRFGDIFAVACSALTLLSLLVPNRWWRRAGTSSGEGSGKIAATS